MNKSIVDVDLRECKDLPPHIRIRELKFLEKITGDKKYGEYAKRLENQLNGVATRGTVDAFTQKSRLPMNTLDKLHHEPTPVGMLPFSLGPKSFNSGFGFAK